MANGSSWQSPTVIGGGGCRCTKPAAALGVQVSLLVYHPHPPFFTTVIGLEHKDRRERSTSSRKGTDESGEFRSSYYNWDGGCCSQGVVAGGRSGRKQHMRPNRSRHCKWWRRMRREGKRSENASSAGQAERFQRIATVQESWRP
ncbi:unnamed protein product [Phaeothamnion confervicola]